MEKLPTAEQWLSNHKDLSIYDVEAHDEGGYLGVDRRALYNIMTEFAKFHVEAALKAAAKSYRANELNMSDCPDYLENSILTAYPLTNIK